MCLIVQQKIYTYIEIKQLTWDAQYISILFSIVCTMPSSTITDCESEENQKKLWKLNFPYSYIVYMCECVYDLVFKLLPWCLFANLSVFLLILIHFGDRIFCRFSFKTFRQLGNGKPCFATYYMLFQCVVHKFVLILVINKKKNEHSTYRSHVTVIYNTTLVLNRHSNVQINKNKFVNSSDIDRDSHTQKMDILSLPLWWQSMNRQKQIQHEIYHRNKIISFYSHSKLNLNYLSQRSESRRNILFHLFESIFVYVFLHQDKQ